MKHKQRKRIAAILAALLLLTCGGIFLYAADYYHMDNSAAAAMESSDTITVETTSKLAIFRPRHAKIGFVFYPGGKVEHTAYAPLMRTLAEEGVLCVIPHMPLNLAVMDINISEDITDRFPEIETWYIGGHSLGGSMAATHAASCNKVKALVLLAAYSTIDLTDSNLQVLSIYGTEDDVLNMEKYAEYFPNLPESTTETVLEGANHAGFGSYGAQKGDGLAYFSNHEQTAMTASAILEFMGLQDSDNEVYRLYLQNEDGAWLRSVLTLDTAQKQYYLSEPFHSSHLNAGTYTMENGVLTCRNWEGDALYCFDMTHSGMVFRATDSAPLYAHASVFDSSPNAQQIVPDGAIYH